MRRRVLVNSVRRLLPDDVDLIDVVFMWRRSALVPLWAALAAVGLFFVTSVFAGGSASVGVALAGAIIVSVVSTENRVLAHTSRGADLFEAGRVRQVAVLSMGPLPADATVDLVGSNLVLTDWMVNGERYSVPKSSQAAMTALADVF